MRAKFIAFCFLIVSTEAVFNDYITGIKKYFGISEHQDVEETDIFQRKVPYEVSITDEKFINEAAKLTGVVLSELDSCQHRVII